MFDIKGASLLAALRPKNHGSPLNAHVVSGVQEPKLDFGAMNRLIRGKPSSAEPAELRNDSTKRHVPENS